MPIYNFLLSEICLENINWEDRSFSYHFFDEPSCELINSIKKWGPLTPPLLRPKANQSYQIVLGFNRISALKSLNYKKIPCQIINRRNDKDDGNLWELVISEYLCSGKSHIFDQSVILNKILKIYNKDRLISDILPLFNLPKSSNVLDQIIPLIDLEEELAKSVLLDKISLHMALRLLKLESFERLYLGRFFIYYKFSKSKQFEILEYLLDLKKIFSLEIDQLLAKIGWEISNSSCDIETKNLPQSAEQIRLKIRSLRYPKLTSLEKEYNSAIKSLKLAHGINLKPPPFFEGNTFQLNITYQSKEILKQKIIELNNIIKNQSDTLDTLHKIPFLTTQITK